LKIGHAGENARCWLFRNDGELASRAGGVKAVGLRGFAFFAADPNLLEEMIEANFVVRGNGCAAIGGVGERAIERLAGAVLRGVEVKMAVGELDAAVGLAGDVGIVRDHEDGVAGVVEFAE
jgi:hypothetical protein